MFRKSVFELESHAAPIMNSPGTRKKSLHSLHSCGLMLNCFQTHCTAAFWENEMPSMAKQLNIICGPSWHNSVHLILAKTQLHICVLNKPEHLTISCLIFQDLHLKLHFWFNVKQAWLWHLKMGKQLYKKLQQSLQTIYVYRILPITIKNSYNLNLK